MDATRFLAGNTYKVTHRFHLCARLPEGTTRGSMPEIGMWLRETLTFNAEGRATAPRSTTNLKHFLRQVRSREPEGLPDNWANLMGTQRAISLHREALATNETLNKMFKTSGATRCGSFRLTNGRAADVIKS